MLLSEEGRSGGVMLRSKDRKANGEVQQILECDSNARQLQQSALKVRFAEGTIAGVCRFLAVILALFTRPFISDDLPCRIPMIRSISLTFQHCRVAEQLEFPDVDVPQGGMLLLHGPSGAGKSTWLALAAGLLEAASGTLEIAGQALGAGSHLHGAARDQWRGKTVGFLPQKLHLSDALDVAGNLALAQWAAGLPTDSARIQAALAALDVAALASRKPYQISGGQAQRVALARCVLLQPQIILADEPTASLDDAAAESALALLAQTAQRENATLVVATHDRRVEAFFSTFLSEKGLQRMNFLHKQLSK